MTIFSFRTLGALELRSSSGEEPGAVVGSQKLLALLAYLALAKPRGMHRRDTLVGLLWPELDQERARAGLRHSIYRLRRALGPQAVVSRGDEDIGIDPSVIRCDAATFEDLLDAGSAADALALYRGDLLPGFFLSGAPEFERWLDGERARLRGRASGSAWEHGVAQARAGQPEDATRWARRAAAPAPDDEPLRRRVVTLLAETGDTSGALREYEQFVQRLHAEYEARPSAETVALAERLRRPASGDAGRPKARSVAADRSVVRADDGGEEPNPPPVPDAAQDAPVGRSVRAGTRRVVGRAALLVAALIAVVVGSRAAWSGFGSGDPSGPPTIAVLPFEVRGSRELEYLREGMSDLLSIGLDGVGGLHSADPRLVLAVARKENARQAD